MLIFGHFPSGFGVKPHCVLLQPSLVVVIGTVPANSVEMSERHHKKKRRLTDKLS